MAKNVKPLPLERIRQSILLIRGQKVMLDRDLAVLYGVETKVLKQAVRRNIERFPDDFMFMFAGEELAILRSQFVTLRSWGGSRYPSMSLPNRELRCCQASSIVNGPYV